MECIRGKWSATYVCWEIVVCNVTLLFAQINVISAFAGWEESQKYVLTLQLQCSAAYRGNNLHPTPCTEAEETAAARSDLWNVQHLYRVSVTLTELGNTSSRQADSQSGWRSQTEQLGPVWMWAETAGRKRWGEFGEKEGTKRRCLDVICWSTWTPHRKRVSGQTYYITTHSKHQYVQTNSNKWVCYLTSQQFPLTINI